MNKDELEAKLKEDVAKAEAYAKDNPKTVAYSAMVLIGIVLGAFLSFGWHRMFPGC